MISVEIAYASHFLGGRLRKIGDFDELGFPEPRRARDPVSPSGGRIELEFDFSQGAGDAGSEETAWCVPVSWAAFGEFSGRLDPLLQSSNGRAE